MTAPWRFAATAAAGAVLNLAAFLPPLVTGGGWNPAREPAVLAFLALATLWVVAEAYAVHVARDGEPSIVPAGTLPWVSAVAVFVVLWLALYDRGSLLPLGAVAGAVIGVPLVLAGVALRVTAIRTLGKFFLDAPAVLPEHELVAHGIYGRVRHPAEAGTLLSVLGAVLLLGSGQALIAVVPLAALVAWRIRCEERVLARWRPALWAAYCHDVPALIPRLDARLTPSR